MVICPVSHMRVSVRVRVRVRVRGACGGAGRDELRRVGVR